MGKRGPPARVVPDWIWEYAKLHTVGQSQPLKIALINKLLRWSKRGPSQYKRGPRWSKPTQGWSSAPPAKPPAPSRTMVCRCYSGGMRVVCHGMWVVGHRTAVVAKQHNQQPTNHEGTSRPLHGRRWPMPTADVCTFPILQIHSGLSCAQTHEGWGAFRVAVCPSARKDGCTYWCVRSTLTGFRPSPQKQCPRCVPLPAHGRRGRLRAVARRSRPVANLGVSATSMVAHVLGRAVISDDFYVVLSELSWNFKPRGDLVF